MPHVSLRTLRKHATERLLWGYGQAKSKSGVLSTSHKKGFCSHFFLEKLVFMSNVEKRRSVKKDLHIFNRSAGVAWGMKQKCYSITTHNGVSEFLRRSHVRNYHCFSQHRDVNISWLLTCRATDLWSGTFYLRQWQMYLRGVGVRRRQWLWWWHRRTRLWWVLMMTLWWPWP